MESFQSLPVLIVSFVFLCGYFSGVCCINCPDDDCPDNLPYCSPVGCVFECPIGSFIEDKQCKTDCGDEYILDDQCIEVCPQTAPFVETEVITIGHQFIKLRYCRTGCRPGTYDFQYECVRSCPNDNKFIHDGVCNSSCDPDKYRLNVTINGHLTAIECVTSCEFDSRRRYILNGYCVSECNSDQVVYDGKCRGICPPESKIRDTNEDGVTFCKRECDAWKRPYVQNGVCVAKCRTDLVSVRNVCSAKCPDNMSLKYKDHSGNIHCKDKCNAYPGNLLEGDNCVSRCKPDHMVYGTGCVQLCPDNAPVHVTAQDQWGVQQVYCRINCIVGGHGYAYNNTCFEICPENSHYVFNGLCLKACPNKASYYCTDNDCPRYSDSSIRSNGQVYNISHCMSECPSSLKAYHYECKTSCPSETYNLKDTCVDKCNGSAPYISGNYVCNAVSCRHVFKRMVCTKSGLNCTSARPYRSSVGHCVSKCNPYEIIDDNKCINSTQCGQKKMVFRGYCTAFCPVGYVYLRDGRGLPCTAKKDIILQMVLYVTLAVCYIGAMMLYLSTKKFDLCIYFQKMWKRV